MKIFYKWFSFFILFHSSSLFAEYPAPSARAATAVSNAIIQNLINRGFSLSDPRVPATARAVLRLGGSLAGVAGMGFLGGVATGIGLGIGSAMLIGGGAYMVCQMAGGCQIQVPPIVPPQPYKQPTDPLIPGSFGGASGAYEHPESIVECTETSTFKNCQFWSDCQLQQDSYLCLTQYVYWTDKASGQISQERHSGNKIFPTILRSDNAGPIYEGEGSGGQRPGIVNPYLSAPAVYDSGAGVNPGTNLSPEQLGADASPEALARMADALYEAASRSSSSSYGEPIVPRNAYAPITPALVAGMPSAGNPITVGDLMSPPSVSYGRANVDDSVNLYRELDIASVSSVTGTGDPTVSPDTQSPPPDLNLGPDPGIPYVDLSVGSPNVLVSPFLDLVSPIFNSDFSAAGGSCPVFSFSIFLGDFQFDQICLFLESYRALFYALTLFGFLFSSIRIILSA